VTNPAQMRVAARPKPEINIGPVDLSCAFVVCDISIQDMPIVYCSENFSRLTAYTNVEILGRNCRFLQAPDGKVEPGVRRKYVDDRSVLSLKNKISNREEVQLSLINYRKGGQPFMNLLTMIPVQWDTLEFKYYVGFQVDLVEQPNSVAGRNPGRLSPFSVSWTRLTSCRRHICHQLST
jgi:PAS domain-containing protein